MATDVDVQYFSHLNGLVLDNNWGDMIRLLDACLVSGVELPDVTSASIDEQGDVHLTLFAPHKAMLLQVVELAGFEPVSLNQKYRIKGVPSNSQIILKPQSALTETIIAKKGVSKLASLGYDIVFRDVNDVKRVYRAKNPTAQHPFIRADESLASPDGASGVYNSTYAKFAMVGLLEHMAHIDDYENPNVLQLPFDPANPAKNWNISGAGGDVVRGWSRWYWRKRGGSHPGEQYSDADTAIPSGNGQFTLAGNADAFNLITSIHQNNLSRKIMMGCGLFDSAVLSEVIPNWFLGGAITLSTASNFYSTIYHSPNMTMLASGPTGGKFLVTKNNILSRLSTHEYANCSVTGYGSGLLDSHPKSNIAATDFPFSDDDGYLRGSLKHVCFSRKNHVYGITTPLLEDTSMYVYDNAYNSAGAADILGGFYFYLGELS
ncbi:hypothetical protein [Acinetobacter johnsonii]|uniref:hypothetical protein n=1 Tax=Acinetobacter johnsonii TaxID=40214 RepID=UPI0032B43412